MERYLVNEYGGWGMHLGGDTTVFVTALFYVVFRILRMEPTNRLAAPYQEQLLVLGKYALRN